MTERLEKAFAEAAQLSEEEQDALAAWLLEELASERHWSRAFETSADALESLADEALSEQRAGRARQLDPREL